MDEVVPGLKFTTETSEDFSNKWLPTLDVQLKMEDQQERVRDVWEKRVIRYNFFEKPGISENYDIISLL